jgi:excisionase family DNA binding protein
MAPEERWVEVDEVATHLGVARDSVYRWVERKGLPAYRVGRLLRFRLSEVDAWVRRGGGDEAVEPAEQGGGHVAKSGSTSRREKP